jgi:peptidoglycan hydrolase-like protein with peptidoglycan-binding domain
MTRPLPFARPLPTAAAALALLAAGPALAGPYDGTYEFVSEGWRGELLVEEGSDGRLYFDVFNENPPLSCGAVGAAALDGNTMTWVDPVTGARLTVRFFAENAEIEAPAGLPEGCGARAQIAGVYISTDDDVTLDAGHVRRLQTALDKLGFEPGPIDGALGPKTRGALSAWQAAQGRPATGAATLESLWRVETDLREATAAATGTASAAPPPPTAPETAPETAAAPAPPRPADPTEGAVPVEFSFDIARAFRGWLDRVYAPAVAPQVIDFTNPPFEIALVDLDRRPTGTTNQVEILVHWNDALFCGSTGCSFDVLRWDGNAYEPVLETMATEIRLGPGYTDGVRDLVVDDRLMTWTGESWTVDAYQPERVR